MFAPNPCHRCHSYALPPPECSVPQVRDELKALRAQHSEDLADLSFHHDGERPLDV